jgi:replication-associated recombination protein RarA
LEDLVSAIRRRESRSLLLHGEAGVGKTALLAHSVASASDLPVVRVAAVELEMESCSRPRRRGRSTSFSVRAWSG